MGLSWWRSTTTRCPAVLDPVAAAAKTPRSCIRPRHQCDGPPRIRLGRRAPAIGPGRRQRQPGAQSVEPQFDGPAGDVRRGRQLGRRPRAARHLGLDADAAVPRAGRRTPCASRPTRCGCISTSTSAAATASSAASSMPCSPGTCPPAAPPVKLIEDRAENMHGGDFHGPDRIFDVEMPAYRRRRLHPHRDRRDRRRGRLPRPLAVAAGQAHRRNRRAVPHRLQRDLQRDRCDHQQDRSGRRSRLRPVADQLRHRSRRGRGCPQAGHGPAGLRRRNFIQPDEFPYHIPSGTEYDSGNYPAVLDKAIEPAGPARPAAAAPATSCARRANWPGSASPPAWNPAAATRSSRTS